MNMALLAFTEVFFGLLELTRAAVRQNQPRTQEFSYQPPFFSRKCLPTRCQKPRCAPNRRPPRPHQAGVNLISKVRAFLARAARPRAFRGRITGDGGGYHGRRQLGAVVGLAKGGKRGAAAAVWCGRSAAGVPGRNPYCRVIFWKYIAKNRRGPVWGLAGQIATPAAAGSGAAAEALGQDLKLVDFLI